VKLRRVRRAMALTTVIVAVVCIPAGPVLADLGDPDPGGGNATTSTTVDTTPTTDPSPDSTTTTTTTPTDSSTTTTAPADDDAGATTTSSSTSTSTTAPDGSTTSTSIPSSRGSGRSTNTTRPSSTTTTAPGSTTTTAPAPSPAGAVVTDDTADAAIPGGDAGAAGGSTRSGGSGRTTHPSPTRPDKDAETAANPPDPNWFDASGLGGLLGVGADNLVPAGETPDLALTDSESALPSRDQGSSSSAALLGLSLLILLGLAGGAAYRWWDRRPDRYWPA
jgi:hypothetical protein